MPERFPFFSFSTWADGGRSESPMEGFFGFETSEVTHAPLFLPYFLVVGWVAVPVVLRQSDPSPSGV